MVRRFDRTDTGQRLHFASAMTMTGHSDGDDASTGVSYLELAEVIMGHGSQPNADLRELWSRIVFNILVSNTDDHLRNHGFILVPGKGWKLSQNLFKVSCATPAFLRRPHPCLRHTRAGGCPAAAFAMDVAVIAARPLLDSRLCGNDGGKRL